MIHSTTKTKDDDVEDKKESSKTYMEQTKLLVTLASAFIIAPAVLYTDLAELNRDTLIWMEVCFVLSVLSGYVVFGTISGTQYKGDYDIYRTATRCSSLIQLGFYIGGLIILIIGFTTQPSVKNTSPKVKTETINSPKQSVKEGVK